MPAEAFNANENYEMFEKETSDNDNDNNSQHETHNDKMNDKSPSSMFATKLNSMLAAKRETNKVPRNHIGKIVPGQPITEQEIYGKITEHKSEQSKSSKGSKR